MPALPDLPDELEALYETLLGTAAGSVARAGQREMLHAIGAHLADAKFEPDVEPRVCVVEAGTGVGKTRAYLAAGITLARRASVKLVVSTSTIALQEQVLNKDLPELARALEVPPTIALLKGRGRYLCPVKLDQACSGEQTPMTLEDGSALQAPPLERFQALATRWASGSWNGERDSLGPEDLKLWSHLAADRHACTSRHCPQFNHCPYFDAKRAASRADILVANHDLVLASLRSDASALPNGERAIYIFDEAHHLPATALSHFACEASLSDRRWLQRLDKALDQAARSLRYPLPLEGSTSLLNQSLDDLLRGVMATQGNEAIGQLHEAAEAAESKDLGAASAPGQPSTRIRFPQGVLPDELVPLWQAVEQQAQRLHAKATELSAWMKELRGEDEALAPVIALHVTEIGGPFKRLSDLLETAELMLDNGDPPAAKWLDFSVGGGSLRVVARACPLFASGVLRRELWPRMSAVVLTSATLRALGNFDFFLRDSGLHGRPHVQALSVASPFNYAAQGRFTVVQTRASPKQPAEHNAEVARLLAEDLKQVEAGALLLCASWAQLHTLMAALPASLKRQCKVQGELARETQLREHRAAVERGERSILVGLQSFGEGLDLPGSLCEWVFMPKLPFMTPDDPVQEARAEWLDGHGRSSFVELVVPATGVRLNQWAGRGIRSEADHAHIVCYDPRLATTPFGKQLMAGLPGFTKVLRRADGSEQAL
ncbi:ATP-dependent DNA helicase DinG [Inhella gelatinilytica]|uniref:ATP-dependent DNA helicase DinG n=1 Tax=Inhella gelatinilytica TaxID=2795030 RepID=A0A931N9V9_9BURK|nr:ATP-dependent DNA helicase DinG [Inhella gelatinilytica]MBH9551793.1 ATP-dependent DNA helicase DinG [Inhella gelatinilytica]